MNSFAAPSRSRSARARWLFIVTGALWVALIAGYLGKMWWPLELFSHFNVQYAALFLFVAIVALMAKLRIVATLAGAGALVSGVPVVTYAGLTSPASAAATEFRLVSFNTWYRNRDHARWTEYLQRVDADVVVLQEITPQQVEELRARLPTYRHIYAQAAKPHGAAIISRWPIASAATLELTPDGVRAADIRIRWRDTNIALVGVHLHWPLGPDASRMRNLELAALAERANQIDVPVLVSGDFNITPWSRRLREFSSQSGLADCARGHGLAPTWPAQFPPLQIRIDHCFASPHWRVVNVKSGPYLGSDHRPMVVELELKAADWPLAAGKPPREGNHQEI